VAIEFRVRDELASGMVASCRATSPPQQTIVDSVGGFAVDCDQVFKILTSGPFPTGEPWDEQVEAHLESCADCWRLAEALRPALEVFQEAVPPAESRDLPGYWGDARPAPAIFGDMTHGASRTALAAGVRLATRPQRSYETYPLPSEFTLDVFRAIALVATITLAAASLVLLFRG
jgi:hypothetical protein